MNCIKGSEGFKAKHQLTQGVTDDGRRYARYFLLHPLLWRKLWSGTISADLRTGKD